MIELEAVSLDDLRRLLDEVDEKVPTQRVLTAIGRKLGMSTDTLAALNDVSEQTIRNWLHRFDDQPIDQAPYDGSRSGRPPKLTDDQKAEFFTDLQQSPEAAGYDRQVWVPALVHRHLKETYDVEYSSSQVYRLLHRADPEAEAEFPEIVQKTP